MNRTEIFENRMYEVLLFIHEHQELPEYSSETAKAIKACVDAKFLENIRIIITLDGTIHAASSHPIVNSRGLAFLDRMERSEHFGQETTAGTEYPKPHIEGKWSEDIEEDYRNARNDDERRRILLKAGYDQAHKSEVRRLFDEPLELENRKKHEKKKAVIEKLKNGLSVFLAVIGAVATILTIFEVAVFLSSAV